MTKSKEKPGAPGKRGRPRVWPERMLAKFDEGTLAAIDKVKDAETSRVQFVNDAVRREIERLAKRKGVKL